MFAPDLPAMPDLAALLAVAASRPSLTEMNGAPVEAFLAVLRDAQGDGAAMLATVPNGESRLPLDDTADAPETPDSTPMPPSSPPVLLPPLAPVVPAASVIPSVGEPGPIPSGLPATEPLRTPSVIAVAPFVASGPPAEGAMEVPVPMAAVLPRPPAAVPTVTPDAAQADPRQGAPAPPPVPHAPEPAPPKPSADPGPGVATAMPASAGRAAPAAAPTLEGEGAPSSVRNPGEATATPKTERTADDPSLPAPDAAVQRARPARTSVESAEASVPLKAAPDSAAPQQVGPPTAPVAVAASQLPAAVSGHAVPPAAVPAPSPHMQIARALAPFAPEQWPGASAVLSIRLEPADLGQVEVRIEPARDGTMRVEIVAERPETIALLHRDQHELLRALDRAGLSTHEPPTLSLAGSAGGSTERQAAERQPRHQTQGRHTPDHPPAGDTPAAVPALPMLRAAGHIDLIA